MVLLASLLAACATNPVAEKETLASAEALARSAASAVVNEARSSRVALRMDGALPLVEQRSDPLLDSGFRLDSGSGLFFYEADYSFRSGDVFGAGDSSPPPTAAPQQVGEQVLGQKFQLRAAELAGAPVLMGVDYRQQSQWLVEGENQNAQRQVNLNWAPAIGAVNLQWVNSQVPAEPLDCGFQGSVRMPLAGNGIPLPLDDAALRVGGRDCRVILPGQVVSDLDARTYSAALEWGPQQRAAALQLLAIDPVPVAGAPQIDLSPGYELGFSQKLPAGAWQASTSFALRRVPDLRGDQTLNGWSADASLRRDLRVMALSASLRNGSNSLWFVPEAGQRVNQLDVGLDFTRWASNLLPGQAPSVGMYYSHIRSVGGEESLYDDALQMKFSLLW